MAMQSSSAAGAGSSARPQRQLRRTATNVASYDVDDEDAREEDEEEEEAENQEDDDDGVDRESEDEANSRRKHESRATMRRGDAFQAASPNASSSSSPVPHVRQQQPHMQSQEQGHLPRDRSMAAAKRGTKPRTDGIDNLILPSEGDTGDMPPVAASMDPVDVFTTIINIIREHRVRGRRLAEVIETIPDDAEFQKRAHRLLSLTDVYNRVQDQHHGSSEAFEHDMLRMFACFRRGYVSGSRSYGDSLILQRLYQRLTRSHPRLRDCTVASINQNYQTGDAQHHFSSVHAGPGHVQRGQAGADLTTRPVIRGKIYYSHVIQKGTSFTVGDWVHLINPSDPAKPIIAQIFKVFKKEEERDEPPQISCCWYLRPEQTVHPPSQSFIPDEAIKTGLFSDHAAEDILEKICVLFYTRWYRGRPGKADWDPRSPLYCCEYRYNPANDEFNKIKNWNSCLPEEIRNKEPALNFFPEQLPMPKKIPSPFLRGITGPGRLCDEATFGGPGANGGRFDIPDPFVDPSQVSKKPRRSEIGQQQPVLPDAGGLRSHQASRSSDPWAAGSPAGLPAGVSSRHIPYTSTPTRASTTVSVPARSAPTPQQVTYAQQTMQAFASTLPIKMGQGEYNRLHQLFAGSTAMAVDLNHVSRGLRGAVDPATLARWRDAIRVVAAATTSTDRPSRGQVSRPAGIDRSMVAALSGMEAYVKTLPPATIAVFGEGEAGLDGVKVLRWFAAPPLPQVGEVQDVSSRAPSLEYLYQQALKAKTQ